jgi:hypothetical protein
MSSAVDTKEREFAWAIRRALDESAANLPQPTLERLALARRTALKRKKTESQHEFVLVPAHAMSAGFSLGDAPRRPFGRFKLVWLALALVASLAAIAYWEDQQRLDETADIDTAMLSDELPLNAYLDHGFNAYLSRSR